MRNKKKSCGINSGFIDKVIMQIDSQK